MHVDRDGTGVIVLAGAGELEEKVATGCLHGGVVERETSGSGVQQFTK